MPEVIPEDITYKEPTPREIVVEILADALCELIMRGHGPGRTWDIRNARPAQGALGPDVPGAAAASHEA